MSRRPLFVVVALAPLLFGCATGAAPRGERAAERNYDRNRISAEEVDELRAIAQGTAWDVVRRTRPWWLRPQQVGGAFNRALTPAVFVDEIRRGGISTLRQISLNRVEELRYLPPHEATTRHGTGYRAGAIVVITRRD